MRLDSLEPEYYEYIANRHIRGALSKYKKLSSFSSLVIRTTYSQALETLFALISSFIQAPQCIPAWFVTYRNTDLESIVRKIHNRKTLITLLKSDGLSWKNISEAVFTWLVLNDKDKEAAIKDSFATLWTRFASDFLDEGFTNEYNSIKHGLRIKHGGFYVAIGPQKTPGVPAPRESMTLLGKSEFGSSYVTSQRYKDHPHHLQIRRHHRNWNPEDFAWGLHLASISIKNIVSALRILNGTDPKKIKFYWPNDFSIFLEPWKRIKSVGVTSMSGFNTVDIPDMLINPFSKEKILELYEQGQYGGIRRIMLSSSDNSSQDLP